jgi:ISXO2 transposase-like protein
MHRIFFAERLETGANLYTDEYHLYQMLAHHSEYAHEIINHLEGYVNGRVHTDGIENFWSLLKPTLKGTYVSVDPFHLFRYLDEQCFRFNRRHLTDAGRFALVIGQVIGRRLTYAELTGNNEAESV